eukprot:gene28667-34611_t
MVPGKACPKATQSYIKKSGLPLFHMFDRTALVSSPIIQGPFQDFDDSIDHDAILEVMKHSISNKINSFVVYSHNRKPYSIPHMAKLIQSNLIKREETITIADFGVIGKDADIKKRLDEAKKLTSLEHIDMAFIQINDDVLKNDRLSLQSHMQALEDMCQEGKLQGWGARISITPYNLHKPMPQKVPGESNFFFPMMFEALTSTYAHLCLVLYPLSPSSAIPPTYPLMNDTEDEDDDDDAEEALADRGAVFRDKNDVGGARGSSSEDKSSQQDEDGMKQVEEYLNQERVISRVAHNPLICYRADIPQSDRSVVPPRTIQEAIERLDQVNRVQEKGLRDAPSSAQQASASVHPSPPLILISNLLPPADEAALHAELDRLCPPLKTSKSLEEKAFRIVTSLHVDVCMVDAEYCAALRKWSIGGEDLLSEDHTQDLTEAFEVPP